MISPEDAARGMQEKNRALTAKNDEYVIQAEKYAETKRQYHIAYAKKVLELKAEGNPITIIKEIVNGDKIVAGLRLQMDIADGIMRANKESMADARAAIDSYRSIMSWWKSEKERS